MIWVKIGAFFMFLAVALGAFGAHALKNMFTEDLAKVYHTAVLYHFIHALGIFVVAWLSTHLADSKINTAGILMSAGIILFSGSLYLLAVSGVRWLGAIAPLGGLCFLVAWVLVGLAK